MPNVYRSLVHGCALLVPVLADATSKSLALTGLLLVTLLYALEELLRLKGRNVPLMTQFTVRMSRPEERVGFIAKPIYLALGVILALIIFPRSVAYASIVVVAVGDPVAGYVGERFGRRHVGKKTWEGFLAGTVAACPGTLLLVPPIAGLVGSIVGMLFEFSGVLDDDLTVPLSAGVTMILIGMLA